MSIIKNTFITLCLVGLTSVHACASAASETKEVCIDVKDKQGNVVLLKNGKPKQNCKTMKVHKKLDGTKVPDKK